MPSMWVMFLPLPVKPCSCTSLGLPPQRQESKGVLTILLVRRTKPKRPHHRYTCSIASLHSPSKAEYQPRSGRSMYRQIGYLGS
ncbi:hypothetical protein B0J17DRAFT_647314 [Rhizoctonia solani]|nr:hypothetical protein B0J17DRAFT_647314 [Rhizoctonia solani]